MFAAFTIFSGSSLKHFAPLKHVVLPKSNSLHFWQKKKLTAPFNNMRTLTFKAQPTNAFFAIVNQVFNDSSQLPTTVERAVFKSLSTVHDNETVLGRSRKLGGAAEHLIDGSEKPICRLSFEFQSSHVIERCSKLCLVVYNVVKFTFFQSLIFSLLLLTYSLNTETHINQTCMAHSLVSALNRF